MAAKTGTGQRYKARNEEFALALATGKTPIEAGAIAGFKGEANAKRNAQRPDIKKRVAELRAPHLAKIDEAIGVSIEWATRHLKDVADLALPGLPSVADGLRAIDLTSKLHGWMPSGDSEDGKTPTVIKFQLNIFDNQRNAETAKVIDHEPQKAIPSP
jgi:hypothetical protein